MYTNLHYSFFLDIYIKHVYSSPSLSYCKQKVITSPFTGINKILELKAAVGKIGEFRREQDFEQLQKHLLLP